MPHKTDDFWQAILNLGGDVNVAQKRDESLGGVTLQSKGVSSPPPPPGLSSCFWKRHIHNTVKRSKCQVGCLTSKR